MLGWPKAGSFTHNVHGPLVFSRSLQVQIQSVLSAGHAVFLCLPQPWLLDAKSEGQQSILCKK